MGSNGVQSGPLACSDVSFQSRLGGLSGEWQALSYPTPGVWEASQACFLCIILAPWGHLGVIYGHSNEIYGFVFAIILPYMVGRPRVSWSPRMLWVPGMSVPSSPRCHGTQGFVPFP